MKGVIPGGASCPVLKGDEIEKFEQSYPLSRNGNVSVSNVNGSVIVEAWDRDEVRLEATKIADSKETLADVEIKVNSTADSFSVEADYKGWKWNNRGGEGTRGEMVVWIPEFANDRLAHFEPASATFTEFVLPTADALPYVARVDARSGAVWIGTGAGDLVARFDPGSGTFVEIPLPDDSPLVRHLAVDPRTGDVWGTTSPFPILAPYVFVIRAR